ncbi:hypothetical protein ACFVIM_23100 [Streptomyces sp. NPDC057638]|uniref:hypothetical protein n=1 Tax=Streptomyces sp. NPDC057638 TaxID=3346190 RepID=UPI0036A35CB0
MTFRTLLRVSAAVRVLPFAVALVLFYHHANAYTDDGLGHAPTVVSEALGSIYGYAYAIAAGLGAWESGRLRQDGLWGLGPGRSRFTIAAAALAPGVALTWLMLLLPVALALADDGTAPTAGSLPPLLMALVLCAAHASIGFGVGLRFQRLVAAPVLCVAVLVLVAFSWSVEPMWLRHLFGQYPTTLVFGERASLLSLLPHLLVAGGVAVGGWLLWLPLRPAVVRGALALAVAGGAVAGAWGTARGWDYNPPLVVGAAPERCTGGTPRVCMPTATAHRLASVRADLVSVLADFRAAGVAYAPGLVTDTLNDGRYTPRSTAARWRLPLSTLAERPHARYRLALASVRFSCPHPDPAARRAVQAWVARVTGEEPAYHALGARRAARELARIEALPGADRGGWLPRTLATGCGKGG